MGMDVMKKCEREGGGSVVGGRWSVVIDEPANRNNFVRNGIGSRQNRRKREENSHIHDEEE